MTFDTFVHFLELVSVFIELFKTDQTRLILLSREYQTVDYVDEKTVCHGRSFAFISLTFMLHYFYTRSMTADHIILDGQDMILNFLTISLR